ncbi:SDR family oxidoreductase [Paenibacillus sp. sptzw28]|uniref:SDR family oxidoreductase n=1 Tax=Paenibacillus sp. sptzw28 TaxID=715179 RepID=UPI001C6EBF05|nr:SDR family oxidoreductase [Paenibacillus sp. sptzw28]QYR20872.1 SDR family oxidoreductase [Paenibacillus sp. sptzw28]
MNRQPPVVLITGCSSGFGLHTAIAFASRGCRVIATLRDLGRAQTLLDGANRAGCAGRIVCMELDVTNHEQAGSVIQRAQLEFGGIDIIVNNAGYALGGFAEEVPIERWRELLETNVLGVIALTQAALPGMRARGRGLIINISSISGLLGLPGFAPYAASKYALEGYSESLRHELAPWGIRVVLVEPGAYSTDIWSKGLSAVREDAAADSPYAPQLVRLLARTRAAAERAADPREVAEAVVRIAGKRLPQLRYPIGRGTRLAVLAKALLPWRLYEAIVQRMLR